MARPPKPFSSILTRTSLSFFHSNRFRPVAEKQNDMNLGSVAPTPSWDATDLLDPLGRSDFGSLRGFSGLFLVAAVDRLKNCPSLEGLLNIEAGLCG